MHSPLAFEQTDQDLVAPLLDAQEQRWARGDRVLVERLLEEHPVLRVNASALLCLILNEYSVRQAHGETPTSAEYEQRFPALGDELRIQLMVHENLSSLAGSTSVGGAADRTYIEGAVPAARLPPPAGYEILTELGRGGMGVVYRARQNSVNRLVALKMLRGGGLEQLERFQLEARAMARLQHPNIVGIHDFGEHEGHCFLAMELIEGGDLADRLKTGPLPPRQAAGLVEKLARAAQAAHDQGLIHRDLTPRNVLFARDGTPRITDFGLVKVLGVVEPEHAAKGLDARLRAMSEGTLRGTPPYMAPEQARGAASEVGPETDVYALGALLYECLAGRPPFRAASIFETLRQVCTQPPPPLRLLSPDVPADLEAVCLKCLEKAADERYAKADLLADDLRRFLDDRPTLARPLTTLGRWWRWCRRNQAVAALLAGLILSVTLGMAGIVWKWRAAELAHEASELRAEAEARAHNDARQARDDLASALLALTTSAADIGKVQTRAGEWGPAQRAFETACKVVEDRLRVVPDVQLRSALVRSYGFLGVLREKNGQKVEALAALLKAADQVPPLADANPNELDPQLGESCFVLGAALLNRARFPESEIAFAQAIRCLRSTLERSPTVKTPRVSLSKAYFHLGEVQRRQGKLDSAAATALERMKLWPSQPDEVYDVACELARCVAVLDARPTPLNPADQRERQRLADQAMEVLKKAADLGLTRLEEVPKDPDLKPLHDREDFRRLFLRTKPPGSP